jgi:UDP-N-acetylmuramoyl-L-alanyl-D-glutamate--2,6-diaminopimelate ligase
MKLDNLAQLAGLPCAGGASNPEISSVCSDSRKVTPGSLFVAVEGATVNGHIYIGSAIESGAAAVVCQTPPEGPAPVPFVIVKDGAEALGLIMSAWHDHPSRKLKLVGVTGTNGKTTIATLLYQLFRSMGRRAGLVSTICNYVDGKRLPSTHTTPGQIELQGLLAEMAEAGCEYAFMEVSSHASVQKRISGLNFSGGIFTNLTRDHLDYHLSVENYLAAKKLFFDNLAPAAFALTNSDDRNGAVMLQNTRAARLSYSLRKPADFKGKILESHLDGMEMEINGRAVSLPFAGRFNAYNLLAVFGAAVSLGIPEEEALIRLSAMPPVSGRFETIRSPKGCTFIVDYAHTPDALANVLKSISEVVAGKGKIIVVAGAGGNRDRGKRPLMAREAIRSADRLILTSDNPRNEDPDAIIAEMYDGLDAGERLRALCIADRTSAIKAAYAMAGAKDVILVAGKGHEDYQEVKGVKYRFDDREKIRELF